MFVNGIAFVFDARVCKLLEASQLTYIRKRGQIQPIVKKNSRYSVGRFFGGVCVASIFFSAVCFSIFFPKSDVKNRPKKRKPNGLGGWGGVLLASAYRGIPRFKRTSGPLYFAPAV